MGCFDSIYVTCTCGNKIELQSKSGPCLLRAYRTYATPAGHKPNPVTLPDGVGNDLHDERPTCEKCGKEWQCNVFTLLSVTEPKDYEGALNP